MVSIESLGPSPVLPEKTVTTLEGVEVTMSKITRQKKFDKIQVRDLVESAERGKKLSEQGAVKEDTEATQRAQDTVVSVGGRRDVFVPVVERTERLLEVTNYGVFGHAVNEEVKGFIRETGISGGAAYRKVEVVVETSGGFYRRSCVGVTPAASLGVWDVWVDTMSPIRRRGKTDTVMEKDVGKFLTDEVSGVYLVAPDENNEFVKEALEKARNVESSVEVAAKVLASSDHPGHSEDRALAQELCGGKGGAAAVFDGTGSGGLVSAQAAEVCSKTLGEKVSGVTKLPTAAEAAHLLKTTLIESGAKVRELQKKPGGALADTTATIGLVCKGAKDGELGLATANVGDSRMYVYRPGIGRIVQVTKDDSLVALMAERGEITDEEAHTHPDRNIITKAVGDIKSGGDVKVSIIPVKPGDVCFAVSDGISDNFTPSGLEVAVPEAFRNSFDPETRRVDLKAFSGSLATRAFSISQSPTALQAKPDDISIAVLRVPRS